MMDVEISVVVLAFNEAPTLRTVVYDIRSALLELGVACEILIVDDGSTDETGVQADKLAEQIPMVRVLHHDTNRGLGGGYRSGFDHARGTYLTFFPADGQYPADIIPQFYSNMGALDMLLGYLPHARTSRVGRLLSGGERILYRLLFGPMPRFQGILMFRSTLLKELPLKSEGRGWAILMELIIRAARGGYRLGNQAIELRPRAAGTSKVNNLTTIASNFKQMLQMRALIGKH